MVTDILQKKYSDGLNEMFEEIKPEEIENEAELILRFSILSNSMISIVII